MYLLIEGLELIFHLLANIKECFDKLTLSKIIFLHLQHFQYIQA
jgi:uncharacterized protein YutD